MSAYLGKGFVLSFLFPRARQMPFTTKQEYSEICFRTSHSRLVALSLKELIFLKAKLNDKDNAEVGG